MANTKRSREERKTSAEKLQILAELKRKVRDKKQVLRAKNESGPLGIDLSKQE